MKYRRIRRPNVAKERSGGSVAEVEKFCSGSQGPVGAHKATCQCRFSSTARVRKQNRWTLELEDRRRRDYDGRRGQQSASEYSHAASTSTITTMDSSLELCLSESPILDTSIPFENENVISFASESSFDVLHTILVSHASHSRVISPAFIFSLCYTLGHAQHAPQVLKKFRSWRVLDPSNKYSADTLSQLALDLSRIIDTRREFADQPSIARIRWITREYWNEIQTLAPPPSRPTSSACKKHRHESSQFIHGCSACRLPRRSSLSSISASASFPSLPRQVIPPLPMRPPHAVLSTVKSSPNENEHPLVKIQSTRPRSRTLPSAIKKSNLKTKAKESRAPFGQRNI